eukprot:13572402-Alexandrium_andersonii.AAC.1
MSSLGSLVYAFRGNRCFLLVCTLLVCVHDCGYELYFACTGASCPRRCSSVGTRGLAARAQSVAE